MKNTLMVETDVTKKLQLPDLVHGIRVAELSVELAEYMNLNIDVKKLYLSGALHDIGKALVDEKILNKPGPLTNKDMLQMKNHAKYGALICLDIGIDQDIISNILYHHENYNGTGYPKGLRGKEIPLEARILRISDTYCALTTKRPYRNKKTKWETLDIMEKEKRFYDPILYKGFIELMKKGKGIEDDK